MPRLSTLWSIPESMAPSLSILFFSIIILVWMKSMAPQWDVICGSQEWQKDQPSSKLVVEIVFHMFMELLDNTFESWENSRGVSVVSDCLYISGPFYRDSRLMSIGGGADEVMLGIICKYMDTLPKNWCNHHLLCCWYCANHLQWTA